MKWPFGKYKGEDIIDLPIEYLQWVEQQSFLNPLVREEVQYELTRRLGDVSSLGKVKQPCKRGH